MGFQLPRRRPLRGPVDHADLGYHQRHLGFRRGARLLPGRRRDLLALRTCSLALSVRILIGRPIPSLWTLGSPTCAFNTPATPTDHLRHVAPLRKAAPRRVCVGCYLIILGCA